MAKVNHEAALLLEQPLIKVPYEQLRRNLKTSQKLIERDFLALQKEVNEVTANLSSNPAQSTKALDGMITRLEGLKRKLDDLQRKENATVQSSVRRRLTHLASFDDVTSTSDPAYAEWSETRLDRWLVDWALRNSRPMTARAIAKSRSMEDLVDVELFTSIQRIEDALTRQSCVEALSWCSQNKVALNKMKSSFELELRLQEFIELARSRRSVEAMAYAKKHFTSFFETHARDVTHCMGLLACGPETVTRRYKRLYDPSRWTSLIQSFRNVAYTLYSLPLTPSLNLALYAGLASLKLPACYDPASRNVDCPTCDLNVIAKSVPWSHHVNSTIVCRLSGRIMDENNPPMAFPDGQVYSAEALKEMADRSGGLVTCPLTKQTVDYNDLYKVFIT